ncbi:hypothetical protein BH23ACT5_BH23ACT5_11350 [soil metagenome]
MAALRRLLPLAALTAVLALAAALPALATDAPDDTAPLTTTPESGEVGMVSPPAVTVPPPPPPLGPDDWTYRYLIPTLLALAVVVVVMTTVQYFTQVVRKRYKVVE